MNIPMISIITPSYNKGAFLEEALNSVLSQSFKDWECIIIDDGSTDNTREIGEQWALSDKRFKYYYKKNGGVSSARNYAITKASGTYILPLDADDNIHEDYLSKIVYAFQENPNLKLVSSRIQKFGYAHDEYVLPEYSYKRLLYSNCFSHCSAFKKIDWERIGGYDEEIPSLEDWEFWIRLLDEKSEVLKIQELLFNYRKHKTNSLSNRFYSDPDFYFEMYDLVYKKNKILYDAYFPRPIIAFQHREELLAFNNKIKNTLVFKIYTFLKKTKKKLGF